MGGPTPIWAQLNIRLNVPSGGHTQVADERGGNEDVGWAEVMDRGMPETHQSRVDTTAQDVSTFSTPAWPLAAKPHR